MNSKKKQIKRRQFLASSAVGIGLAATQSLEASSLLQEKNKSKNADKDKYVSLKDAHKGTLEIDLRIMNQLPDIPQEVRDFYVACREALTGKDADNQIAKVCSEHNVKKLGGPMLGDLTSSSVSIWMHLPTKDAVKVALVSPNGKQAFESQASTNPVVLCEGLRPDTEYEYTVSNSAGDELGAGKFTTAPTELSEKPFRLAFGADFHKIGMYRAELLKLIQNRGARAMFLIGDSAVDGRKNDPGLIKTDYMLRNLSPPVQQLTANVPTSATWDDHDYWGDDVSGTVGHRNRTVEVELLRKMWKMQWNNPQRDLDRAGIYFEAQIGPVHYIALDTRSCRLNDKRGELNSFLGPQQMNWLKETLEVSTSQFILISGGTMWTDYISKAKDTWGTWDIEGRETIFGWIDAKKDSQVLLLSGDRHGARGFKIPRPNGKTLYEFEIGTLGGCPGPDPFGEDRSQQLFGLESRSWAFGELTFKLRNGKPDATFRLIDASGKVVQRILT